MKINLNFKPFHNYLYLQDFKYPESLNPYLILGVTENSSHKECQLAFLNQATSKNRMQRCKASLAYDILCNKSKYEKFGNEYRIKNKDCFYYVVIGDYYSLRDSLKYNKSDIYKKDSLQRSLLYLAARNGFYNLCELLIQKGIDINDVQKDGSTALHGAAFYGQVEIVKLLIDYGADINKRNNFGNLASDEAQNFLIKEMILNSNNDQIKFLYQKLYSQGLVSNLVLIKKKDVVVAKKLLFSSNLLPYNFNFIKNNWIPIWHGTKYEYLESIVINGLKPSGSKLKNGTVLKPPKGHIPLGTKIDGIENWAGAVFVSPSILYSSHIAYSERILSEKKNWAVLVQGYVRPNCYTEHNSTVLSYAKREGEPDKIEFRVPCPKDEKIIYRVDKNNQNLVIYSITFVWVEFLDNITDYVEGNLVINSKEEREILT